MPTDANGNYSLPASYFVENGNTILPVQHNPPLEDLGDGMTARVMRNGSAAMTGELNMDANKIIGLAAGVDPLDAVNMTQFATAAKVNVAQTWPAVQKFPNATAIKSGNVGAGVAALFFEDSAATRMGYVGVPSIGGPEVAIRADSSSLKLDAFGSIVFHPSNGAETARFNSTAFTSTVPVRTPNGTVSAPSIAWASNTDTGFYTTGSDCRFTSNGADILSFGATGLNVNLTPGSGVFGVNDAVKNIITNGGQIDVTNTTGGSTLRLSRAGNGTVQSTHTGTTQVGAITITGGNTTNYVTTSNEDFKEFIGLFSPEEAIRIIRSDPVRDWNWVEEYGGGYGLGWGAQTSYAISPDLATPGRGKPGDKDYQEWGVDKGARTPYLWAALTWALDKIEELETRLTAAGL